MTSLLKMVYTTYVRSWDYITVIYLHPNFPFGDQKRIILSYLILFHSAYTIVS